MTAPNVTVKQVADGLIARRITPDEAKDLLTGFRAVRSQPAQSGSDLLARDASDPEPWDDNDIRWLEWAFIMNAITNDEVDDIGSVMM
jgi:hypothetical protein